MSDKKEKSKIVFDSIQTKANEFNDIIVKNSHSPQNEQMMMDLIKHAVGSANKRRQVPRLAFTEDPHQYDHYAGIYKIKKDLLPSTIIKKIRVQNLLVAAILRARGNTLSMFGHVRKDRFDIGMDVSIKKEFKDFIEPEQMVKIQERIDKFTRLLINCGNTDGVRDEEKMNLPEFLDIQVRNGLSFGWFGTEIIYDDKGENKEFNRFRPVDAGTIYRAVRDGKASESTRASSITALKQLTGAKIDLDMFNKGEYTWVQAIDGTPRQAFTNQELIMYNLYPSSDIEHQGYPVTPLDTAITSTMTHISIELYNKLYFQNGRAAKGMLVIQSDEIDQSTLEDIKQQYNASINDVTNSFRTPLFGVGKDDTVTWVPTVANNKDGEFQFLYDQVTRNILAAFNMGPDELPGYGHLSRGTNQQALSESSNEWKLTSARDTGLRPLLLKIQDYFNEKIFSIIDPELAQLCVISLGGLDSQTKQEESTRLTTDMPIHMDYDTLMGEVEKQPIGTHMGGKLPFNERLQQKFDIYIGVNRIISEFNESPAAYVDPTLNYKRDAFFFQNLQILSQYNPEALIAYFSTRKDSMKTLKFLIQDYLEENE